MFAIPRKHKALMLRQPELLMLEEVPTPIPAEDAVLIKVKSAGICHSDLHRWKGEVPCPEARLAGAGTHEVVGTIVARGESVPESIKEGENVLVYPLGLYKIEDKYTRSGLTHHAKTMEHFGGMQEYVLVPHYRGLVSVEGLEDVSAAAPLACAALTAYGAVKKARPYVEPNGYVAVIGLGGLGSYAVQWAKIFMPYANLIGIDVRDEPLKFASKLTKIDFLINASKEDAAKTINELTQNEGANAIIDFVGTKETISLYIETLSHFGIYIPVGIMGNEVTFKDLPSLLAKEITIQGSFMGSLQDQHEVVELARRKLVKYSEIVTRRLKFNAQNVNQAFKDLDQRKILGRQIVSID